MQYKQRISPGRAVCGSTGACITVRPSRAYLYDTVTAGVYVPSRYSEPRLSTPASLPALRCRNFNNHFFTLTSKIHLFLWIFSFFGILFVWNFSKTPRLFVWKILINAFYLLIYNSLIYLIVIALAITSSFNIDTKKLISIFCVLFERIINIYYLCRQDYAHGTAWLIV